MDQLIPIVSKLQDVLGAVGQNTQLDLPQIVVVRLWFFCFSCFDKFLGLMSYDRGDTIVFVGKLLYAVNCIYNRVPQASNISFWF